MDRDEFTYMELLKQSSHYFELAILEVNKNTPASYQKAKEYRYTSACLYNSARQKIKEIQAQKAANKG